jgi:hypothetical protein
VAFAQDYLNNSKVYLIAEKMMIAASIHFMVLAGTIF